MKMLIAGSRNLQVDLSVFDDLLEAHQTLYPDQIHQGPLTVVTGGAKGIDAIGNAWALERGYRTLVMKAEWDKYGKRAGYLRNVAMASTGIEYAIIVWDGKSRGSKMMVDILDKRGIRYDTVLID